jgi:hypothetical protein
MGIFEVGDRLQGVGELPLMNMGFKRAVEMVCCMIFFWRKVRALNVTFTCITARTATKVGQICQASL